MSINSAVAFTLRNDTGADQTLWLGFEAIEEVQYTLAYGLADDRDTRAEAVGSVVRSVLAETDDAVGLSFAQPPGITHTIHTFDFNEEKVILSDPDTGAVKVAFPFKNFLERHGF